MKDGGDVILFPKARDESITPDVDVLKKRTEDFGDRFCQHRVQLVLDQEAHQLICPACNQALDPFTWILDYIRKWARQNTRYRQAVQQANEAETRLLDLQRQERNAKARIRKKGVLLSGPDARLLRDHLRKCSSVLDAAFRYGDEEWQTKMKEWVDVFGIDIAAYREAFKPLNDAIELQLKDEPEAA